MICCHLVKTHSSNIFNIATIKHLSGENALIPMQLLPSHVGYDWTKEDEEDDELQPVLMTQESAPLKIAELISCQCKASACKTGRCKCSKNGMKCTPACICEGQRETCQNPNNEYDEKDWTSKSETESDIEEDEIESEQQSVKHFLELL